MKGNSNELSLTGTLIWARTHTHSHTHKLIVGLNRLQEEKEQEQEGDETQGLLKNERKSEGL